MSLTLEPRAVGWRPILSELVRTARWNERQHLLHQITMRVEERRAHPPRQILGHETRKKRRLARSGLAEEPEVPEAIFGQEPEAVADVPVRRLPEDEEVVFSICKTVSWE